MKKLFLAAILSFTVNAFAITEKEAEEIAIDAYVYAYPLVTIDLTKDVLTNTVKPTLLPSPKAPMGQIIS